MTPRPCLTPGCPNMAVGGARGPRCRSCQRRWDAARNTRPERQAYLDPVWRSIPLLGPCVACGATEDLTRDHITPLSAGGTNDPSNCQILCRACNSRKHNHTA